MTYCCRGVCATLVDRIPSSLRYTFDHKRCSMCSIFVKTINLGCPCCGARLRTKPRCKKYRK